ncbi:MAG: hypothetical protein ACRD8O_13450 [Bryobacteraceae bacterium]
MHRPYDITLDITRRRFVLGGFGWFPFFRPKHAALEGARFRIVRNGSSNRRYIHIHGNESTAREVLTAHLRRFRGTGFMIEGTVRNVPCGSKVLDPNRMFSREGAAKNLRRLNPEMPEEELRAALDRLDRGRDRLVRTLLPPRGGLLFAVHNNSEGYSVRDEVSISDKVSLPRAGQPHEFFLCTQPADFEKLQSSSYNVVLQNTAPTEDDGSLSRLAALRGVRYVNLECALGNARAQVEMLEWAERNLS